MPSRSAALHHPRLLCLTLFSQSQSSEKRFHFLVRFRSLVETVVCAAISRGQEVQETTLTSMLSTVPSRQRPHEPSAVATVWMLISYQINILHC